MFMRSSMVIALTFACSVAAIAADEWPQFRGPNGNAIANGEQLPLEWNAEKNIAWKVMLPGVGWSQPVVWGDKIFLTTATTENQQKPRAGGGFGGPGGRRGGFGPPNGGPRGGGDNDRESNPAVQLPERAATDQKSENETPRRPDGADGVQGDAGRGGGPRRGGFGPGRGGFGGGQAPDAVYQWKVLCLDANTGSVLWEKLAHEGKPRIGIQPSNTYATETPITDGERVYAYFGMTGLFCFSVEGDLLWKKDLGAYQIMFGPGSSPAFDGERIFVQCDNDEKSFLVALDKKTGDEVWRVDRPERGTWSTPYIWKNKLRTELVTSGNVVRSYDPATGQLLWEYGTLGGATKATPVGDDELLIVGNSGGMGGGMRGPGGFGGGPGRGPAAGGPPAGEAPGGGAVGRRMTNSPLVAIKAGATGDISLTGTATSNSSVVWSVAPAGSEMASPLLYNGNVYVLQRGNGVIGCYDAKTGKEHYRKRLEGARSFVASPIASGGKIYSVDETGQAFILEAGPELKLLAMNKLDEMFWSSPAVAKDKLLLRGVDHLYCIKQQ